MPWQKRNRNIILSANENHTVKPDDGLPHDPPGKRAPHIELQDIDNDGMIDLMTAVCDKFIYRHEGVVDGIPRFGIPVESGWEPAFVSPLLRNVTKSAKNYIAIKPELKDSPNRNGIGARVEIYKAGMLGKEEGFLDTPIMSVSNGYSSGSEAIAYFGVPHDKTVDILMTMPTGGKVYIREGVKRNQMILINE